MTWIQTFSGGQFDLANLEFTEIDILDVMHALSNTCRFSGHCCEFYSVAQHSVMVSYLVPKHLAFEALMHDAAEAFLTDIPAPFKPMMPDYVAHEKRVHRCIADQFGLAYEIDPLIKQADMVALATERRDLLFKTNDVWDCLKGVNPHVKKIVPLSPNEAFKEFKVRYNQIVRVRKAA